MLKHALFDKVCAKLYVHREFSSGYLLTAALAMQRRSTLKHDQAAVSLAPVDETSASRCISETTMWSLQAIPYNGCDY